MHNKNSRYVHNTKDSDETTIFVASKDEMIYSLRFVARKKATQNYKIMDGLLVFIYPFVVVT